MKYTAAQEQAIQTLDQNLQIIACAGSGKTQVISARIVELLAGGTPLAASSPSPSPNRLLLTCIS